MSKSASQPATFSSSKSSSTTKRSAEDKENRASQKDAHFAGDASAEVERLTRKVKRLEDALADTESERDAAVKHFEELQAVRNTKVEQQLDRVKEKAMEKHKLQEKLISSLKEQVKSLEATVSSGLIAVENASAGSSTARDAPAPSASTSSGTRDAGTSEMAAELKKLRDEMAKRERDWKIERSSLQDQVRQLERENKAEREASKAALQKAAKNSHTTSGEAPAASHNDDADKIRALYEDLTGLTISSVETYDSRHGFRRFRGVFASPGYHHLQLCVEESTSDLPPSSDKNARKPGSAPRKRQDLVYIPQIQEDRDAELLKAGTFPSFFLGQIRFDRSSSVKFLDKLHRGLERNKLVDDIVYEVDSQTVTIKEGDVDIGGNPSAEEADEGVEDGAKTVNNFAHAFSLQPTSFDKKTFLVYLKGYMKAVKSQLPEDRVAEFEKGAQAFAKKLVANFKDYEFYTGESMNPDGMVALLNYREDGVTPYWTLWKDGLKETKV
ncbi:hypothetical protein OC835_003335 [Tilletia horrida]|nr:hypothetical protein OC835_003335 [Tilletia horrida]